LIQNAEQSYNYSKKLGSKRRGAIKAIEITLKQIEQVKQQEEVEKQKEEDKKKEVKGKRFWFESYRWFIARNGNIVVAGRDAKTNDLVVKKYLKSGDRYAHADVHGAPSVIIKSKDASGVETTINDETLEEACIFGACYSKAWKQFAEAQAYWVLPEQVSKSAQSGEFVPRGAFIIRGKRNYVKCKLELAVGIIQIENTKKIMGGPVESVKKISDRYIILQPGEIKKNDISRKLAKIFNVSSEEASRALPPGGVTIIETIGFEIRGGKQ